MLRKELLNKLLNMDSPVTSITNELNKLGWDSEEELIDLTCKHILLILEKYCAGTINENEVEEWANIIENREDIGRDKAHENKITQIIYELSNPYLMEPLTKQRAEFLMSKLK
jgi:hypothetical protein